MSLIGKAVRPRNAGKPPIPLGDGVSASRRGLSFNLGGGRQDAETFMRQYGMSGTIYGIISLLAESSATPAWNLYKKQPVDGRRRYSTSDQGSDQRVQVVQHPAIQLINNPNDWHSRFEFFEGCQQHEELTGETFWVLDLEAGFPTSMWYVRPDRMEPVPDPNNFLLGWIYTGPTGEQIPLKTEEVILEKRPNPLDPYRGAGPVASILPNIQQQRYATEYQRNLFLNGADPGGVIQVPNRLSEPEFDDLVDRWRESHRGVARAGQIGVLESGAQWIPSTHSNKDMEYGQLRLANRDELREAWRIHKSMMGSSDDVNRANAQTAQEIFVAWQVLPRLNRRRDTLNSKLLPLFGGTGKGVEFDYEDPSPVNAETAATELLQKAQAAAALLATNRFDPRDILEAVGLPDMDVQDVPAAAAPPQIPPPNASQLGDQGQNRARRSITMIRAARDDSEDGDDSGEDDDEGQKTAPPHDLTKTDEHWKKAVAAAVILYLTKIVYVQRKQIAEQIEKLVDAGNIAGLAQMTVDHEDGARLLLTSMSMLAVVSAQHAAAEAKAQGATVTPQTPKDAELAATAEAAAAVAAAGLALSAATQAARLAVADPEATGADIAAEVDQFLDELSDASLTTRISGAMSAAQNAARTATFLNGPSADLYASEVNDKNTCLMPDTLVTTRRGRIPAANVHAADEILTHLGRWVRPSRIPVSFVDEDVIVLQLADGRELRTTHDHHVLVVEDGVHVWRAAGQLTAGCLLIDQSSLQEQRELAVPDLRLGYAPHGVAATGQVGSFAPVHVRAQRVPVTSVGFDDDALVNEEVDGPRPDRSLRAEDETPCFEQLANGALDAGFQATGHIAMRRAVAAPDRTAWRGPEDGAAQLAGDHYGWSAAGFAAVGPVLSLAVPERGTAALAHGGSPSGVHGARLGAVVVATVHGDGDVECGTAVRTHLVDPLERRPDFGPHFGVGELAGDAAIDGPSLVATRDLATTGLAVAGRVLKAPALPGSVRPASETPGDFGAALNTRSIHYVSVLQVYQRPYRGLVYDFTIPNDETFWAEGVLVHNCSPCRAVDGTYIGNTADDNIDDEVAALYPNGGYVGCAGSDRCRGTVIADYSSAGSSNRRRPVIKAKDAGAKAYQQEAPDYPPEAVAWMHHADWSGPVNVPVGHIDWTPGEMEGPDPDHVQEFVARIRAGKKLKPVILVKTPKGDQLQLVDGHHRYLAAAELGAPVRAFIGVVDKNHGPWESMHKQQYPGGHSADGGTANAATLSKPQVHYRDATDADRRCGTCSMFRAPNGCTLVKGLIRPGGVCDRYTPGNDASAALRRVLSDGWMPIEIGGRR